MQAQWEVMGRSKQFITLIAFAATVILVLGTTAFLTTKNNSSPQHSAVPTSETTHEATANSAARHADPPAPMRGVTLDSIEHLDTAVQLLESSPEQLTVRLVIDPNESLATYDRTIDALDPHVYVMAQILDSEEMPKFSEQDIRKRTQEALDTIGDKVDLWEVGNELNGAWVGSSPAEINTKAVAANEVIKQAGGNTAVTLNYWPSHDCYSHDWEATLPYAQQMPESLRNADYVFLSIYETACNPPQRPSVADIAKTLNSLGKTFPKARLGIGETGVQNTSDGMHSDGTLAQKEELANYYYGMQSELESEVGERYVGGYFWWYFHDDAVQPAAEQKTESLWPTIQRLTANL